MSRSPRKHSKFLKDELRTLTTQEKYSKNTFCEKIKITPRNPRQSQHLIAIEANSEIFVVGSAGTGKTFITVAKICDLYQTGKYEQIILTVPAIGCGEKHGFVPGKLNEKLEVWYKQIFDALNKCLGKATVQRLRSQEKIRLEDFEHMQGVTFENSLIFLDEAQNTTKQQIRLFISRTGEKSKLIIAGALDQSYLTDIDENGLVYQLRLIEKYKPKGVALVKYEAKDIIRSETAKRWGMIYEADDKSKKLETELPVISRSKLSLLKSNKVNLSVLKGSSDNFNGSSAMVLPILKPSLVDA